MKILKLIDRLIKAGHFERVYVAGQYAAFRATAIRISGLNLRFGLNLEHETNALYHAIDEMLDADELDLVHDYIVAKLDDEPADMLFAAIDQLFGNPYRGQAETLRSMRIIANRVDSYAALPEEEEEVDGFVHDDFRLYA